MEVRRFAFFLKFLESALGAGFRPGEKVNFQLGAGKDDRSLIASFCYKVLTVSEILLQRDHQSANVRVVGGEFGNSRNLGSANLIGNVFRPQIDFLAAAVVFHPQRNAFDGVRQLVWIVPVDSLFLSP